MKQEYIRPMGQVMAVRLRENIATSAGGDIGGGTGGGTGGGIAGGGSGNPASSLYGVTYRQEGDTVYISTGTYVASSTGSTTFDSFYDLVTSYVYDLTSVCRI